MWSSPLSETPFVIFNPTAGRGRGARLVGPVLEALSEGGGQVEHVLTTEAGEEGSLAESAIARGFKTVVAVGGDGTWSNVGNAILRSGEPVRLGLVSGGTGSDLVKSLGIPGRDVGGCARIILEGRSRAIDVGRVEDKYFLNILGFGYDVAVLEHSWTVRHLKGEILYLYSALRQIYSFPGFPVTLRQDGGAESHRQLLMMIVANAQVFGGAFRIAPRARLDDGRLDCMSFHNMGLPQRLRLMVQLLRGTHEAAPEVEATTPSTIDLVFQTPPAYEIDGEWNRAASERVHVECVPGALSVLVPPAT